MPLLSIQGLTVRFGGIVALDGVSFDVEPNTIVGLIGPNGAGKTTLFNVVTRVYQPVAGDVQLDGRSILDQRVDKIVGLGIARTFQNVELWPRMTVLENLLVGLHSRMDAPAYLLGAALGLPHVGAVERRAREQAADALEWVGLGNLANRPVAGLPYGTLKAIELARAIATRPRLLLLDEPAGGLNHDEVAELVELFRKIHRELNLTMLVVEHHMNLVMRISDKVVCLDFGRKIADGTPREVQSDPRVIEAYLGADSGAA